MDVALDLKGRIVRRARELGAVSVRVTSARRDETTDVRMRDSFARGDLATWGYDEGYARTASDPQRILPGAQSVICIAVPYATPRRRRQRRGTGRVSNYAWSADYHRRMRLLLAELARAIDELAAAPVTRAVCDTAPLAERAFAERAGVGWQGKHTNLIVHGAGSYVFLGEIVTTLSLEPDPALRTTCGNCTRCVSACPTGALRGDYTIDATRCISDLTQRTDAIPRALRPYVGEWVWGCDLCQEACPPTQRASVTGGDAFAPIDEGSAAPALEELLRMRSAEYRRRWRPTAMGWRGAAVLRRNAAVALGNTLDRGYVPALVDALCSDPHPLVRSHAAWALGRIGSPRARAALAKRRDAENDPGVCDEIDAALAESA